MFRDGSEDVECKAGGMWIVRRDEWNIAVHKSRQEADLAAQAVKFGNEQRSAREAAALNSRP
jgi:hypothetical protein